MPADDSFATYMDVTFGPARRGEVVTPHNTNSLNFTTKGLYVGSSGDLTVRFIDAVSDTVITGVVAGTILPIRITHIRATGTTANNILAFA
jgi:hypothetical protein